MFRKRRDRDNLAEAVGDELYSWVVRKAATTDAASTAPEEIAAGISRRSSYEISADHVALLASVALSPDKLSWVRVDVDGDEVLATDVLPDVEGDPEFGSLLEAVKANKVQGEEAKRDAAQEFLAYARERKARLGDLQLLHGRLLAGMPQSAGAYYIVDTALRLLNPGADS